MKKGWFVPRLHSNVRPKSERDLLSDRFTSVAQANTRQANHWTGSTIGSKRPGEFLDPFFFNRECLKTFP